METRQREGGFFATLRSVKHIEWIVVMLLVGVVILVAANMLPKEDPDPQQELQAVSTYAEPLESRMEAALSLIEGAGRVHVLVNRDTADDSAQEVVGVIVVAEGAQSLSVRVELARAVQSLLDVPQSNIEIFAMAKESEE